MKILMIEDEPLIQRIHQGYLQKIDATFQIVVGKDLDEARQYLKNDDIDLILLDIHLKGAHGLDLLSEIDRLTKVPDVIIISAATQSQFAQQALQAGVIDYLIKPFTFERFQQAILKWQQKRSMLQQEFIDQASLDALFQPTVTNNPTIEIEKGLSKDTLIQILNHLTNRQVSFTIQELATELSLSHVSIRKYIQFLEQHQILTSETIYLKVGRPHQRYHLQESQIPTFLNKLET
ncbi:response regulator [Enterococcus cecorum]|uniref:response regulator n=1 Tax=Enterococcus cecorum TaxID=44008 RepID=UPI000B3AF311|nr:response regulator [Enterococcus cecorum]OUN47962.1 DNA-binding response regulator [Enterococcus cecorum]